MPAFLGEVFRCIWQERAKIIAEIRDKYQVAPNGGPGR